MRPDGGNLTQCDGKTDAPYSANANRACAWKHPFYALPPKKSTLQSPFAGGDVLMLAAGDYAMGAGGINDTGYGPCDTPSGTSYDCETRPIPSGTDALPTRIVGAGFDGMCSAAPELWGTYRSAQVLNMTGSSNVTIACVDITDHAQCTRFHASNEFKCNDAQGVVEGYGYVGIYAEDSQHIELRDMKIHGLDRGIQAGRIGDWTLDRVHIRGNLSAGFDGDISGDDHNTGPVTLRNGSISWSGCIERYPNPEGEPVGCLSQDRGGYGDGLGTGATSGEWTFDHFDFLYNVSDGLDLLYLDNANSHVEVKNSHYEGNAGNAIKLAQGGHVVSNVTVVGNCGFFNQPTKWPDMVNHCRALGNTFSLGSSANDAPIKISNVSGWSEGDCFMLYSGPIELKDSIAVGAKDFHQTSETSCFAYTEDGASITVENTALYNFKSGCDKGLNGACSDPHYKAGAATQSSHDDPTYAFDLSLAPDSPLAGRVPPLGSQQP